MNGRSIGALLVVAVVALTMLACNRSQNSATADPVPKAQQWEYKAVSLEEKHPPPQAVEAEFNKLGAEGWEHSGGFELYKISVFKRPKR